MSMEANDLKAGLLEASLVIPTHNRSQQLRRCLEALSLQDFPASDFEVIVAADGCRDDTAQAVKAFLSPYALSLVELPGVGAGAARNAGAQMARGRVLIFLDDDIETEPGFISAHLRNHPPGTQHVVIGYLHPEFIGKEGWMQAELRQWWNSFFHSLSTPGRCFLYTDLVSGNFSLPTGLFHQSGGFDASFHCREDYELGLRLVNLAEAFIFERCAESRHVDATSLRRTLRRKREEGAADVLIGQRYPPVRSGLKLAAWLHDERLRMRILRWLAFNAPAFGDLLVSFLGVFFPIGETLRLRGSWQSLLAALMGYSYWRGAAEELPSIESVRRFLEDGSSFQEDILELDLLQGLTVVEACLDERRPSRLKLFWGGLAIGELPGAAGGERLRGAHLRPALSGSLAYSLLKARATEAALTGRMGGEVDAD